MPIKKLERLKDERGLYTTEHDCVVECDQCGKQFAFRTSRPFTDVTHPPEVDENGLITVLKPWSYDFICKEHADAPR